MSPPGSVMEKEEEGKGRREERGEGTFYTAIFHVVLGWPKLQ